MSAAFNSSNTLLLLLACVAAASDRIHNIRTGCGKSWRRAVPVSAGREETLIVTRYASKQGRRKLRVTRAITKRRRTENNRT